MASLLLSSAMARTAAGFIDLSFENSDNVTYALVNGFTGMAGDNLDTDNDGVLDVTPWSSVVDALGLQETPNGVPTGNDGDDFGYGISLGGSALGPDGTFVPGHAFRLDDGTGDWSIGGFDLGTNDTPGVSNAIPEPSSTFAETHFFEESDSVLLVSG